MLANANLESLDLIVDSTFSVAGVSFKATALEFTYLNTSLTKQSDGSYTGTYDPSQYQFAMTGTAEVSFKGVDNALHVTFGHGSTPGLVLANANLESLDLIVDSTFSVAGVSFKATALEFTYLNSSLTKQSDGSYTGTYDPSQYQFAMTGKADVSFKGVDDALHVTFGHGSTPGLVLANANLERLDLIVDSTFHVSRVAFTASALELTYTASNREFTLTGDAQVGIQNIGNLLVKFGYNGAPGIVITAGELKSLDMKIDSNVTIGSAKFITQGLEFTYRSSDNQFTLTGSATVTIRNVDHLSVTFGHNGSPGLVISNGALTYLDMTIDSYIVMGSATFATTGLEFTYYSSIQSFSLTGSVKVTIGNIDNLFVTFGYNGNPGLVITDGSLTSLDLRIDSNFTIASATFTTTGLEFTYLSSADQFTLTGSAKVDIRNMGNLSVRFGHNGNPGLVIAKGNLQSLDMTIKSDVVIGSATFALKDLEFIYASSTQRFTLTGLAAVTIRNIGNLSVEFGHNGNPGLVIVAGSLNSMDMTIKSNIVIGSATFVTQDLEFTYRSDGNQFTLAGLAGVKIQNIGNLSVTFGYYRNPGLIISNGALLYLDLKIESDIKVGSATFYTNGLEFTYSAMNGQFTLAGTVAVDIRKIGGLSVTFGRLADNVSQDGFGNPLNSRSVYYYYPTSIVLTASYQTGSKFYYRNTVLDPGFYPTGISAIPYNVSTDGFGASISYSTNYVYYSNGLILTVPYSNNNVTYSAGVYSAGWYPAGVSGSTSTSRLHHNQ